MKCALLPKYCTLKLEGKVIFKRQKDEVASKTQMVWLRFSETALQRAACIRSIVPSHFLPFINIKTMVAWQQIFNSEKFYCGIFSSKNKIGKGISLSVLLKIFQPGLFQLEGSIQIMVNKHLLHAMYSSSCRGSRLRVPDKMDESRNNAHNVLWQRYV